MAGSKRASWLYSSLLVLFSSQPASLPSSFHFKSSQPTNVIYLQSKYLYHGLCRAHKNECDIYRCKFSAGLGLHTLDESCRSDEAQAAIPCAEIPAGSTEHSQKMWLDSNSSRHADGLQFHSLCTGTAAK